MEGAKGRTGEGGVGVSQGLDERFPGEGTVLVRRAVLALEHAAEKLQAVVPPDLVLVRRRKHPRQIGHDAVGQFGQGEDFVGGGIPFGGCGSRIVGQESAFLFHRFQPFLHRIGQSRGGIHDRITCGRLPNADIENRSIVWNQMNETTIRGRFRYRAYWKNGSKKTDQDGKDCRCSQYLCEVVMFHVFYERCQQ